MGEDGKSEMGKNSRRTGDWNKLATVQMHLNCQCVANGSWSQLSLWLPSFLSLGHYSIIHLTVTNFPGSTFIANWITILQLWSYFNWIVILLHWKAEKKVFDRVHSLSLHPENSLPEKRSIQSPVMKLTDFVCQKVLDCHAKSEFDFTYTCAIRVWCEVWN